MYPCPLKFRTYLPFKPVYHDDEWSKIYMMLDSYSFMNYHFIMIIDPHTFDPRTGVIGYYNDDP